jgi:hypothetical protein
MNVQLGEVVGALKAFFFVPSGAKGGIDFHRGRMQSLLIHFLGYNYPGVYLIVSKLIEAIIHSEREPSNVQSGNATTNTAVVLPDHQLLSTH